jgi:hypothetical protein
MSGIRAISTEPRVTRQFLVHIDATLIRRVKILAIDRNISASKVVQEALIAFVANAGAMVPADIEADAP